MSTPNQLPGTSVTNGDGNQEEPQSMIRLALPLFLETLEEQATEEEEAVLQQERDDEDYQAFSFLLDDYKTLRVPAALYKRNTCRFCNKPLGERKYLTIHLGRGKSKKIACTKYGNRASSHPERELLFARFDEDEPPKKKQKL
ncbi:hypothetical protein CEP53_004675 [Fusarium sp. AF-6]|nr:hypothetical protein CEP53_004675 [Fusarium sp. AF-6]